MHEANIIRSQLLLHKVYIEAFKEKHPKPFRLLFASLQSAKPIYGL